VRPVPEHRRGLRVPGGLGEVLLHDHLAHPLHPLLPLHPPPLRPRPRHPPDPQAYNHSNLWVFSGKRLRKHGTCYRPRLSLN
jgi:hypothetical protein